jgi:tripartite-type tricarboxylate transporter receptor subunit TctC
VLSAGDPGARRAVAQVVGRQSRIVVGFPPGGAPDVVARLTADALRGSYAPTVIVENKPGAGGRIAAEAVKNGDADGSAMLVTPNPIITIYPHVYRRLSYDPLHDLTLVTSLCSFPLVLTAGPALPASVKSLGDLVPWARAHPGSASFGTPAAGSTLHFIGVVFANAAGIELVHVPYKGGPEVVNDLIGGRIPLAVTPPAPVVPHIQAGKLRALATTSVQRSSVLPDVPTFRESGYPQLDMKDWIGLFVPAKTPQDVVMKIHGEVVKILGNPDLKSKLGPQGIELVTNSPADFGRFIREDNAKWGKIIKDAGIKGD